jgi:hypothetical protein
MHTTVRRALDSGALILFGQAPVYRHTQTGHLVADMDAIRRRARLDSFETGHFDYEEFGYDDDDDDFGYDDFDEDDDDFGYDDEDDEFDDEDFEDEDDDFGYEFGGRKERKQRRSGRRVRRKSRRVERLERQIDKLKGSKGKKHQGWAKTIVSGTDTLGAAGTAKVRIRLQHDFKSEDITFAGSTPVNGVLITSIFFGDRQIFNDADGVDASVFGTSSFLRGLLKGQNLRAGLDILVTADLNAAGSLKAAITGLKPLTR